jgi:ATP synthase protein I
MKGSKFSDDIRKSAHDLMESRKQTGKFWHYARVLGVGGWLMAIPIVSGAYLGRYLDAKFGQAGTTSWTITCILIGIFVGFYNVWYIFIKRPGK